MQVYKNGSVLQIRFNFSYVFWGAGIKFSKTLMYQYFWITTMVFNVVDYETQVGNEFWMNDSYQWPDKFKYVKRCYFYVFDEFWDCVKIYFWFRFVISDPKNTFTKYQHFSSWWNLTVFIKQKELQNFNPMFDFPQSQHNNIFLEVGA